MRKSRAARRFSSFERGTLTLVMGPSGSGKTTLLSMLGCLLSPDEGTVFVDGAAVKPALLNLKKNRNSPKRKLALYFQAFRLFHSLSAIGQRSSRL